MYVVRRFNTWAAVGVTWALVGACNSVTATPDAGQLPDAEVVATADANAADAKIAIDAAPATYTIGGTVTGFAGRDFVLQLNGGDDLQVEADGTFIFATAIADTTEFTVSALSEPRCPQRICTLANNIGTLAGANVSDVTVTCAEPQYRLASLSWGDDAVRITDDITALDTRAVAAPRLLEGVLTGQSGGTHDAISLDVRRDLIYVAVGGAVHVWENASTVEGSVAPSRIITIADESSLESLELDEVRDRIYVSGRSTLYALDLASTLSGEVTPAAAIAVDLSQVISLDRIQDRLYVGGDYSEEVFVFDNASSLTSASTEDRKITWMVGSAGFNGPPGLAVDGCNDRLYLGSNANTPAGYNLVVFDNASLLDGAVNLDTDSQAQYDNNGSISLVVDSAGRLYSWPDSPRLVNIFDTPETWTGVVTPMIDKVISAVVDRGYGMDVVAY